MVMVEDRVAIVTGAGRGIGAAIARRLSAEGALVVVNDLGVTIDGMGSDATPAHEVVDEIVAAGGTAIPNSGDVSDFADARDLIDCAIDNFGRLDVLINAAGIVRPRMLFNMTEDEWDAVIRVHLKGTFNTSRFAASYWRKLEDGQAHHRLINFTSSAGLYGSTSQPNYAAAKA